MLDFYIDIGISVVITLLRTQIKTPTAKAKFKAIFLKINKLLFGVYGSDPDFKDVWE